ncbi:hypothetical protein K470DRAFT_261686 [Piedraia hortae CBS 480.64]|uniref:Uncharacterized protein n=1 Tax=Piedraia hortae CBS 480.64 TaxID=1314780 RepID=A0A6A7CAY0_9PEZI|nr:hypothetical protein K470DRAFT_261686 [Piedraia hortae CBS 480.64]
MSTTWSNIQSLVLLLGPILLPRLIAYTRTLTQQQPSTTRRKPPPQLPLALLTLTTLTSLILTLPIFTPTNIYMETSLPLTAPAERLQSRLRRSLTSPEQTYLSFLKEHGPPASKLYSLYGPAAFPSWTDPKDHLGNFIYALPGILTPHLLHLAIMGVVTGRQASRFRGRAVAACIALLGSELFYLHRGEGEFKFWKGRVVRLLGFAGVDVILGGMVLLAREGVSERVEGVRDGMEGLVKTLRGLGCVRNTVVRSSKLRGREGEFWETETDLMRGVFENEGVVVAQKGVLGRIDLEGVREEAGELVDSLLGRRDGTS